MNTKKLLLTSALVLTIACPVLADPVTPNIAANAESASCTQPVLGTTSGTSNLQANWSANTLNIDWYDGDEKITSTTCTYDGGIVVPDEEPEKEGYTFNGWTIRRASAAPTPTPSQCSIPSGYLSETTYVLASKSINHNEFCEGLAGYDEENGEIWYGTNEGNADCSDSRFAHLSDGEWSVTFSGGMVKGRALCSSTSGDWGTAGTPNTSGGGQYCWCQPTSYIANGSNACSLNVAASSWVFNADYLDADVCAYDCAYYCAYNVQYEGSFRAAVFGVAQ